MASVKEIVALMNQASEADVDLVTRAYEFAERAHKDHARRSGEPYFTHLFETAKGLAEMGMGARTIAAGFLHDSIEDVGVTEQEIEEQFGSEVLFLVQGVTKLGSIKYRGLERHSESLRKLFVATSQDIRVLIIKLMDRLHNMKTLEHVPKEKQRRIAMETLEIYAPVANRLGMGRLYRELEDLAFPFVYPAEYEATKKLMREQSKATLKHLEKLQKSLKKELAKQNIKNFRMEHRVKGMYSLFRKLERKDNDITKIHDILALRIMLPSIEDCYRVLGIVHQIWRPLPGKIKDYIAFPKPNGYRSLHTTVFTGGDGIVEIQLRTEDMHQEAQFGIASHIAYKSQLEQKSGSGGLDWIRYLLPRLLRSGGGSGTRSVIDGSKPAKLQAPAWVKQIAEVNTGESGEFLATLKTDFFSHRVFVFTPEGDVLDLPINSSPIDFAYALHSDIGDHISGAKVNGKMVTLDTELKNGDIVEIITKEASHPTSKWVDMARTTLAKRHIRSWLAHRNENAG